jgi:hypothetical protein
MLKLRLLVGVSAVVAALAVVAGAAAAPKPVPYRPGAIVWTCDLIAANPVAAAAAGVSCDPDAPPVAATPTMAALLDIGIQPMANDCQRVPGSGYIGQGVFASSSAEYANQWNWGQGTWGELYTWYLKHTDNSTYAWSSTYGADSVNVPANIYYWKVQNNGADAQAWNVCYYTS